MEHFFSCIEEKAMQVLENVKEFINTELEETDSRADDYLIIQKIDEAVALLKCRINRSEDRCSGGECMRKATHFNSLGEAKCKYH